MFATETTLRSLMVSSSVVSNKPFQTLILTERVRAQERQILDLPMRGIPTIPFLRWTWKWKTTTIPNSPWSARKNAHRIVYMTGTWPALMGINWGTCFWLDQKFILTYNRQVVASPRMERLLIPYCIVVNVFDIIDWCLSLDYKVGRNIGRRWQID